MFVFNYLGSVLSSLIRLLRLHLSQTCDMERCCFLHSLTCFISTLPIPWVGGGGGGWQREVWPTCQDWQGKPHLLNTGWCHAIPSVWPSDEDQGAIVATCRGIKNLIHRRWQRRIQSPHNDSLSLSSETLACDVAQYLLTREWETHLMSLGAF